MSSSSKRALWYTYSHSHIQKRACIYKHTQILTHTLSHLCTHTHIHTCTPGILSEDPDTSHQDLSSWHVDGMWSMYIYTVPAPTVMDTWSQTHVHVQRLKATGTKMLKASPHAPPTSPLLTGSNSLWRQTYFNHVSEARHTQNILIPPSLKGTSNWL